MLSCGLLRCVGGRRLGELIEGDLAARHPFRVAGERREVVEQTLEGTEHGPVGLGSPGRRGRRGRRTRGRGDGIGSLGRILVAEGEWCSRPA